MNETRQDTSSGAGPVKRFEDLKAWQKARELIKAIYEVTGQGRFARDFVLRDQIRRASVSVGSNVAEGFERGGDKEFLQFLSQAKGSCGEVRSQLYFAADQSYLDPARASELLAMADEVSRIIGGLMTYLRRSDFRGKKYAD